ncbi:MAG: hypothetical protein LBR44_11785 [Clostridiales Family XIII bacterium]|nr:hypothetical protein [Clostridiales Family XIII bacterium]
MKKRILAGVALLALLAATLLSGCFFPLGAPSQEGASGRTGATGTDSDFDIEIVDGSGSDASVFTKEYGSYEVPAGWVEVAEHSSGGKYFYAKKGTEREETPDNVSIEYGTNRYALGDRETFKESITWQLEMQTGDADAVTAVEEQQTAQGYPLLVFLIGFDSNAGGLTKQYYIVGDKQYILIHVTAWSGSMEVDDVGRTMVDSFVWADDLGEAPMDEWLFSAYIPSAVMDLLEGHELDPADSPVVGAYTTTSGCLMTLLEDGGYRWQDTPDAPVITGSYEVYEGTAKNLDDGSLEYVTESDTGPVYTVFVTFDEGQGTMPGTVQVLDTYTKDVYRVTDIVNSIQFEATRDK